MKTIEMNIKDRKFSLKQLNYFDVIETAGLKDRREHAKKIMELSGVPDEIINGELEPEDGASIMTAINELNGWSGFQKPSMNEEKI